MIKNLLFDMGNVLIRFEPALFIRRAGLDGGDAALLLREVFRSVEWVSLDRGSISDDEALAAMKKRLPPQLHVPAETLVRRWEQPYTPVPGMEELVKDLSAAGYGLYLLTNAACRHREYWPQFPVAAYFGDRVMLSADWRILKPEAAFFERALAMFRLEREECVFIDDAPGNVEGAVRCGIAGIVFHGDGALLRENLAQLGVSM